MQLDVVNGNEILSKIELKIHVLEAPASTFTVSVSLASFDLKPPKYFIRQCCGLDFF